MITEVGDPLTHLQIRSTPWNENHVRTRAVPVQWSPAKNFVRTIAERQEQGTLVAATIWGAAASGSRLVTNTLHHRG